MPSSKPRTTRNSTSRLSATLSKNEIIDLIDSPEKKKQETTSSQDDAPNSSEKRKLNLSKSSKRSRTDDNTIIIDC